MLFWNKLIHVAILEKVNFFGYTNDLVRHVIMRNFLNLKNVVEYSQKEIIHHPKS